jgi:hypothetical protein
MTVLMPRAIIGRGNFGKKISWKYKKEEEE